MGLFNRLKALSGQPSTAQHPRPRGAQQTARIYPGTESLEIVGESFHQAALWSICGGSIGDRVRYQITAVLVPEPDNPYDPNAIAVQIGTEAVGHLDRESAIRYGPGVRRLMQPHGEYVALEGVIVGGGYHEDGPGRLGVWLDHDPSDFGLEPIGPSGSTPVRTSSARSAHFGGTMRTGLGEASLTDAEDDSYDLSWYDDLPTADRSAVELLRDLLANEPDPIDRHFQFAELESRLYRRRDLDDTALDEFDTVCRLHDAEMEAICAAFRSKWGKVPLLETYRQMAIRQQKKKDWNACLWWVDRGLALYGDAPARATFVDDLLKRRRRALEKLDAAGNDHGRRAAPR